MENKKEEKIYYGLVDRIKVEGKTYKDFTLNYLNAIIETYKDLPTPERVKAYIEYFVNNFSYDKEERDKRLKNNQEPETKEFKEKELFELFYTNKGVCEQFSVGFALLCRMDEDIKRDFDIFVADCKIETFQEMNHALNIFNTTDSFMLLDLSAMIHCKEKDNVGKIWDYGPVSVEKYIENQKRNDFKIIPNGTDGGTYLLVYRNNSMNNIGGYYDLLTQPADVLNTDLRNEWFNVDISSYFEENNVNI